MKQLTGQEYSDTLPFFEAAAKEARGAMCLNAKCGSVIVKDGKIIGRGHNGPAHDDVANRYCTVEFDSSKKRKYDTTCCTHAEWRAVLDACKQSGQDVDGSTLYFMRVDENGNFTDAGEPYCTVCSRLTLESGVAEFALWNNGAADLYLILEYNQKSYKFYI